MFIRIGFILIIITILTIHTTSSLPTEIDMLIGGLLIAVSYALIKYLQTPKHGSTLKTLIRIKRFPLNAGSF